MLSISEANNLFADNNSRVCYPTAYAKAQGVRIYENYNGSCKWWLRSPGTKNYDGNNAANIRSGGGVSDLGDGVIISDVSVRPAMWINLGIPTDDTGNIANKVVYKDSTTLREVQFLLNAAGYDCGAADGIAGKLTNDKILEYKRDHGLLEDTDITDELLESLRGN